MAKSKSPRKKYQPREALNSVKIAMIRAARLTDAERKMLLDPVWECFDLLRRSELSAVEYKHLADVMNVAQALTQPGIGLLPDHVDKFNAAHEALKALANRFNAGGNWTCYSHEIEAIKVGIEYHAIQLEFASAGELTRATIMVDNVLKGARSGSASKDNFHTSLRAA